jgi:hypothetical protein
VDMDTHRAAHRDVFGDQLKVKNMKKAFTFVAAPVLIVACGQRAENVPITGRPPTSAPATTASPAPATTPLPDSAYKVTYSDVNPPKTIKHGEKMKIHVTIRNDGDKSWPGKDVAPYNMVELGARWIPATATPSDYTTRVPLETALAPGAHRTLTIEIAAPDSPGTYTLQLDLVHEGVTWFEWKGQSTPTYRVMVS